MATREELERALRVAHKRAQKGDEQARAHAVQLSRALQQMPKERTGAVGEAVARPYQAIGEAIQTGAPRGGFRGAVGRGYQAAGETLGRGAQTGADAMAGLGRGALRAGQLGAEGASRGLMELIQAPGALLNQAPRLANILPGVEGVGPIVEDYNPAMDLARKLGVVGVTEPEGKLEEAALAGGQAVAQSAAGLGALNLGLRGITNAGPAARYGQDILRTFTSRPGAFTAAEGLGGAGAVLGGEGGERFMEAVGAGETGQQIGRGVGAIGGGVGGGIAAIGAPAAARRGAQYAQERITPFTEQGARRRVAAQLQRQAAPKGDPQQADIIAKAARDVEAAPSGVSPAQATRNPGLMAQEDVIARERPAIGRRLRAAREATQEVAGREFRETFGDPQSQQEWATNMVQRVSAPGATVQAGDTDQMLAQAFDSYRDAYRAFDGYPIRSGTLGRRLSNALDDDSLLVGEETRKGVRTLISNQLNGLGRTAGDAGLRSEDIIALRQNIRAHNRDLARSGTERAAESREVLTRVERELTDYLESHLPEDVRQQMRRLDNQYRQFKMVEDAVYRGGEGALDPKKLLASIQRGAAGSRGAHTRGDQESLRRQVIQGLDGNDLLRDRELIRRAVRGAPTDDVQAVRSKITNAIADQAEQVGAEGTRHLDGAKLMDGLRSNRQALLDSGMSPREVQRLEKLASKVLDVQRRTPEQLDRMFEDGPTTLAELGAALLGAKSGQRMAGGGMGSALVLAQYMSNRARGALELVFNDKATDLMVEAATDPKLYAALLRTPASSIRQQREAARTVEAWILQQLDGMAEEAGFGDEPQP